MKNINFTCPFCSLLCDDIQLEIKENYLKPINSICPILSTSLKKKVDGNVLSLLTGGGGNENYWHWLFDVLPRIKIVSEVYNISEIDQNINDNNDNNNIIDQETQFNPYLEYWLNLEDIKNMQTLNYLGFRTWMASSFISIIFHFTEIYSVAS